MSALSNHYFPVDGAERPGWQRNKIGYIPCLAAATKSIGDQVHKFL
jgi:hypothetical protein